MRNKETYTIVNCIGDDMIERYFTVYIDFKRQTRKQKIESDKYLIDDDEDSSDLYSFCVMTTREDDTDLFDLLADFIECSLEFEWGRINEYEIYEEG